MWKLTHEAFHKHLVNNSILSVANLEDIASKFFDWTIKTLGKVILLPLPYRLEYVQLQEKFH